MAAPTRTSVKADRPVPADLTVDVMTVDGKKSGTATLAGAVFGIEPNVPVMHQVVTAQMAAARAGTHSTKTRAEVRGGGAKPYRQKGTGRARQGSIRAPHWRGGGVAHGPKPRDYSQRTPKKMTRLALRSALSDRAAEGKVAVVDAWGFDTPRTKAAKAAVTALGITARERVLVVLDRDDTVARKSFANLEGEQRVHCILDTELNAYEVLVADWVVFTSSTLAAVNERLVDGSRVAAVAAADASSRPAPASDADSTTEDEEGGE